jgi:alkanesulfonate monooxygenase SsuD/methylene tetrahydromethanopterin reductase-like flavin-dependent oxidoreductase (luciferase family)
VRDGVAALRAQLKTRVIVAALGPKMCRLAGEIADGVLFNWLTPEHARVSAGWVREGAAAAGRKTPTVFAYVRLAVGAKACEKLAEEGGRYAAIPAYGAHFGRMGVKPVETCIAAQKAGEIPMALGKWQGVVDEVVLRAITGDDTIEENLALLRAAKPS